MTEARPAPLQSSRAFNAYLASNSAKNEEGHAAGLALRVHFRCVQALEIIADDRCCAADRTEP